MKRISLIAALLLTIFAGTTTAAPRDGAVSYDASDLRVHDGKLLVTILFRLDSLSLGTDRQLYLTPVVEDGKLVGVISLSDLARSGRFDMEAAQALCEISENIVVR